MYFLGSSSSLASTPASNGVSSNGLSSVVGSALKSSPNESSSLVVASGATSGVTG